MEIMGWLGEGFILVALVRVVYGGGGCGYEGAGGVEINWIWSIFC